MERKTRVALLAAFLTLAALPAASAKSTATCWPGGGITLNYGVLAPPATTNGAIVWEHDTNAFLTSTLPCLVSYDAEPVAHALVAPLAYSVLCYAEGYLVYSGGALEDIAVNEGVWTWTDATSGDLYAASIGCYAIDLPSLAVAEAAAADLHQR